MRTFTEVVAYALVGLAMLIDTRLFVYYSRLSLESIDALWNLPFILTLPAALLGLASLVLFLRLFLSAGGRPSQLVAAGVAALTFIFSIALFYLTNHFIFMR